MAYFFPEGSKFYFSQTFAAAKNVTAITNANPAVATSAAHGLTDGAEVLFLSGWEDATDTVYKVDQLTADSFELEGLNSTSTSFYAPGTGVGTVQVVSGWTEIPQVLTISTQGGDPRMTSISPIARRNSINVPTGFNPTTINMTLGHDPANANYQTMLDVSRTLTRVAFKMVLSGGATTYGYGYLSVSEMAAMNVNQANSVSAAIAMLGRAVSYAS